MKRLTSPLMAALMIILSTGATHAIDIEPGDYTPLPKGANAIALFYNYARSDNFSLDGDKLPDSKFSAQVATLQYNRYSELFGRPFAVQAYLSFGSVQTARIAGQDLDLGKGVGDLTVGATYWPIAADPEDLHGTTLGMTLYASFPTSDYNIGGANLGLGGTVITPQIGLIQGLGGGRFLDVIYDVAFTRDFHKDGAEISVEPQHQVQVWLRQYLSDQTNVAIGYSGLRGGELSLDDVSTGAETNLDEVRFSASHFLDPTTEISGRISWGFNTEDGFANKPRVQLRFVKLF